MATAYSLPPLPSAQRCRLKRNGRSVKISIFSKHFPKKKFFQSFCRFLRFAVRSTSFEKNRSRRCDFFGPKIGKIRAILAIFRSFKVFAGVRYLFGCFEVDPGRKELEIYSVRDLYDSTIIFKPEKPGSRTRSILRNLNQ